jgi:alpha-beta hydrolase superfamily lysophospholipase
MSERQRAILDLPMPAAGAGPGGRKEAIHFGASGRPLFGFYHPPAEATWRATAVVLCNPLGTDMTRSDRTYRQLAERLAAAGFATLRFDFFGTGDSGGDELTPGLVPGWQDDLRAAIDEVRARSGARSLALVGLRLGATLAGIHAASRDDVDSLVLWSPNVTGAGFVGEVTKLHKVYLRMEPHLAAAPPPRERGEEALGFFLPEAMLADLSKLDLREVARRPARRALVLDDGKVAERDALVERLRTLGASPEVQQHPGHKFLATVSHRSVVPTPVLDSIVRWLSDAHPAAGGAPRPESSTPRVAPPSGEQLWVIQEGHPLFAVLTPGTPAKTAAGRPAIVLLNAGCINRQGPHGLYVRMARRWAALGFDVLRMDLSGIGDSPASPGAQENLTYPPEGLQDILRAMQALGPSRRFIVAGLCSGGDYAFQLGAQDAVGRTPRPQHDIVGAWLLNPRTFSVLELAAVESGSPPTTPVDEVPRRLRAMADRGVQTALVVSKRDPGVLYVDERAREGMRALEGVSHFRRVDLDGSDHSFTPRTMQEKVSEVLTEELLRRWG